MPADTEVPPIVQMTGITIRFPGVLALDGVDFRLRGGEIHSLMGENGAGKSTLIKALTGVYADRQRHRSTSPASRASSRSTADAQSAGISTVYQEVNLCANLSVGENVMLGHEPRAVGRIDWKAAHREAARHLENLGLHIDTRSALSSHSIAIQQLVAISRAMVLDAKVLILDEPTSSLDRGEVEQLFASCATCATAASRSSSSATSSTRSTRSPTASRSCATASSSASTSPPTCPARRSSRR